jgi:branched-chain amino acid transport system permease protein
MDDAGGIVGVRIPAPAVKRPVIPWVEAGLVVPALVPGYLTDFASRLLILALFALSFDLVFGYAGIMSFGQAFFFGGAGYVVALLARDFEISSVLVVVPVALAVGFVLAVVVAGFLLLGRHPPSMIFVALGTLTASVAGEELALSWYYLGGQNGILGGQNGIPSIPQLSLGRFEFASIPFFYLVLAIFALVYLGCRALVRSQFGLALAGVRQHEERIGFFGYRAPLLKAALRGRGDRRAGRWALRLSAGLRVAQHDRPGPFDPDRSSLPFWRDRHTGRPDPRRGRHRKLQLLFL